MGRAIYGLSVDSTTAQFFRTGQFGDRAWWMRVPAWIVVALYLLKVINEFELTAKRRIVHG